MSTVAPVTYIDYDYSTLLTALQNQLALKSAWKDLYKSATGEMLIELFAAVGTEVLYYIERRAQESYILTAQNLSSVINLVRLLNYTPVRNVSAIGTLRFTCSSPTSGTNQVFINANVVCQTASGTNYLVSSPGGVINVAAGETYVDVSGVQGILVPVTFTSTGSTAQEYNIDCTTVENSNIIVTVNDTVWTKVTSFLSSTTVSTDYIIRSELDSTITIVFGNGVFGKAPSVGDTIKVEYINSAGLSGNVYTIGLINSVVSSIYNESDVLQTVTVSNTTTFLGGDDAETIEEIRENGPAVFATGDRLVTKSDFNAVIKAYPGVGDVNVWGENEETSPDYTNYNQVKISLILQNWILPDVTFESTLSTYLYTKSLMTVRYSYVDPDILEIIPTLIVDLTTGASISYTESLIDTALTSLFVLGTTTVLGTSKYHSDIVAVIEAITGVNHVYLNLKIRKELSDTHNSTYDWSENMDVLDALPEGVEIYIDDTKIAVDDGSNGWTDVAGSGYTVTGTVNYVSPGLVGVNITPAPGASETVYVRYQTDQSGDIIITQNQIMKYVKSDYTSIS